MLCALTTAPTEPSVLVVIDAQADGAEAVNEFARNEQRSFRVQTADPAPEQDMEAQRQSLAQASEALRQARGLALELKSEAALQKFEEAQAAFGRGVAALDDYAALAQAQIDMGAAYLALRREGPAMLCFRRSLLFSKQVR